MASFAEQVARGVDVLMDRTVAPGFTRIGSAVFAASALLLFAVSAIYHTGTWSPRVWTFLRRFDHANIFVLIAGTYTPITLILLEGTQRVVLLSVVWGCAIAGVFFRVFWTDAPDTDVYLVPANWPCARRAHWQTLLQARAIEKQAYVVGCNRVGTAGDGTGHAGDSRIVSPMGELLATASGVETIVLADVAADEVTATRDRLRFLADRRP